ncbi:Gpi1-domain-containing protein [Gloeophyllum trabeum ATCC 11539]|uniref:Gpi1-domain-containing protein n=1 Tax=Gloeophyllum trabeum (strain ATCC 11539 / FP-39264 / Madison 617) TaxID=670483 RepID=S7PY87_GLOTA|nr:Gpi1-domain-containing protein [Gloeophyllum trabeum ATCC 11539]EPQ52601.1 Gpi1-domain-containing protein [Gloeophyllum trabeum ATCC 11539]
MSPPFVAIELPGLPVSSEDFGFIYYRRPKAGSLHYYTLKAWDDIGRSHAETTSRKLSYPPTYVQGANVQRRLNETVISQMNYAHSLEARLPGTDQTPSSHGRRASFLSTAGRVTSLVGLYLRHLHLPVSYVLALNSPGPFSGYIWNSIWQFMTWISMTVQQCDTRTHQFSTLPTKFRSLRSHPGVPVQDYCAKYDTFYNFVWLVLNDVIVGTAVGTFICENHNALAIELTTFVEDHLIGSIQRILIWLDNWPAGLKLNTELSNFYCSTFIGIIGLWGQILSFVIPYLPTLIYAVGVLGSCGSTMVVSSLLDLLNVFTVHLHICYYIGAAVYRQQLRTLDSLWNLFRGKRFNVLRNRIDNWDYDIDQLLLGTILFTLVAFLFPTVLTYYSLFAVLQFCVILIRASLETLLVFMNHFPLFALMLRVKDPWRLPGGIYFELRKPSTSSPPAMIIRNQPVPFFSVFSQFVRIWSRIASHYNPLRLLRCLITGNYLTSIPGYSIRHRGMPEQEASKAKKG